MIVNPNHKTCMILFARRGRCPMGMLIIPVPSGHRATQERRAQTCDQGDCSGSVLARHNLINPSDSVLDAIVFPSGEKMAR